MADLLTSRDAGELERRVEKERRKRIEAKFGRALMVEVEAINAKVDAGIELGSESNAVLAKVKDIQDAAVAILSRVPSDADAREAFHPQKQSDWPS